ncbi:protein N-lysine methyltransferase METTL21D [Ricinus communis]|uniref:Uncharacterized protein n=1 Tax=Ricinus communis TaxID=3988 RepID=B9S6H5_RICCO|nr:protein N-lysine methyltransferase METTL21D [Ricinus communis]EEF40865.1 conserved hypothetical protein [Ricinus communis]|eukprot:XP_002521594.1 protein-lysine methyltransferase METTL21D [Ricinus communis]
MATKPMASPRQQEDDEEDIDPMKILLPDYELELHNTTTPNLQQDQRHYIPSINSTIMVRQLPSQGLSFQLWPAATTLFTLLDRHRSDPTTGPLSPIFSPDCTPNILELGSGTGLVGIAAAVTLAANVTVTDLPHVISNLQFNVDANADTMALFGGTVNVAALRWGEEGDGDFECIGQDFDVILASDVVYHDHLYEPLLHTLRLVMGAGAGEKKKKKKKVFVMTHLRRWKKDSAFFKRAKKWFDVDVIYVDSPCHGSRIGVVVYRFSQK